MGLRRALIGSTFMVIISAAISAAPSGAWGASVSLAWDPNPAAENVTGFLLYYGGTSRTAPGFTAYAVEKDVGNVLTTTITDVPEDKPWCFALKAYNAAGLRSDYSNEVCTKVIILPGSPHQKKVTVDTERYRADFLDDGSITITPK